MSYSTSRPPRVGVVGGAPNLWFYSSDDGIATVAAAGYFSDGYARGMRDGDLMFVNDGIAWYVRNVSVSGSVVSLFNGTQTVEFVPLTDAASIEIDGGMSNNMLVTLGGNRTLANPTNPKDGAYYNVWVKQDGTGSRTLGYGSKFVFPASTAPVLSTAAGALDILTFQYNAELDLFALVASKSFGAP